MPSRRAPVRFSASWRGTVASAPASRSTGSGTRPQRSSRMGAGRCVRFRAPSRTNPRGWRYTILSTLIESAPCSKRQTRSIAGFNCKVRGTGLAKGKPSNRKTPMLTTAKASWRSGYAEDCKSSNGQQNQALISKVQRNGRRTGAPFAKSYLQQGGQL